MREFALQHRNAQGEWITASRHPTASAAVDAFLGEEAEPGTIYGTRVIEVTAFDIVPVGQPDTRDLSIPGTVAIPYTFGVDRNGGTGGEA